jgi:hypothetical protein
MSGIAKREIFSLLLCHLGFRGVTVITSALQAKSLRCNPAQKHFTVEAAN